METISLILSGLALLAASICLALAVRNEKRSTKRNAALISLVEKERNHAINSAGEYTREEFTRAGEERKKLEYKMVERIEKLEQGITPDYEQAKAAAEAVNSFNQGISNILGFDPHEALIASRKKDGGSE